VIRAEPGVTQRLADHAAGDVGGKEADLWMAAISRLASRSRLCWVRLCATSGRGRVRFGIGSLLLPGVSGTALGWSGLDGSSLPALLGKPPPLHLAQGVPQAGPLGDLEDELCDVVGR